MNEKNKYTEKALDILDAANMNHVEQSAALKDLIDELIIENESKPSHWPGMYFPEQNAQYWLLNNIYDIIEVTKTDNIDADSILIRRACAISCETKEEADFVQAHMKVRLEIIDRLRELNGNWIPDANINSFKYEPAYDRNIDRIIIQESRAYSSLPDWFQARTKQIWNQIIYEEFGEEKVKLALWPKFED